MAKQVVYIGVAVATDGILPERSSIYNITACCGDAYQFTVNVLPKDGEYKQSTFWTKHQDVFNTFRARAVPLEEAMTLFRTWLKQFQGQLVACGSTVDHWHLLTAFLATGKDCPFGSLPIDSATLAMKVRGRARPTSVIDTGEPKTVAKMRWELGSGGVMPRFGEKAAGLKKRARTGDALAQFLMRERERQTLAYNQTAAAQRGMWNPTPTTNVRLTTHTMGDITQDIE